MKIHKTEIPECVQQKLDDTYASIKMESTNTDKKRIRHISGFAKVAMIAAAVVFCFVISNLITWAASGIPWVVTVSNSLFSKEMEKYEDKHREDIFEKEEEIAYEGEAPQEETEDIYAQLGIETMPAEEVEKLDEYYPGMVVILSDLTPEQWAALEEYHQKEWEKEESKKLEAAVEQGYVYLFEEILKYDEDYELPVHDYHYIRKFSPEELENAQFSEDHTWINIQGENYFIMTQYAGSAWGIDEDLSDIDEMTRILYVFTEENYTQKSEIHSIEKLEGMKKDLAIPIFEGRVAVYSNDDNSLIRTFTEEECHAAEISENFQLVRIAGELYIVNYKMDDDHNVTEIRLRPIEGYKGDASAKGADEMEFYTMTDFNLKD